MCDQELILHQVEVAKNNRRRPVDSFVLVQFCLKGEHLMGIELGRPLKNEVYDRNRKVKYMEKIKGVKLKICVVIAMKRDM